ncbi:MAG TPA: ATP-binding protein, partial [Thermoanaerobaculia bacterium]|nr:ATP-binding protein [Thermoanaerobaculia bacterium]
EEEIDFVRQYLEIERIRFEERLHVSFDVERGTERALVPSLALQPLVENAIRHGIAPRPEGGKLAISASRNDGMLEIQLRDDGPGLCRPPRREGIGLTNTRARLAQLYGDAHRFTMTNAEEGGLVITIAIPYHA